MSDPALELKRAAARAALEELPPEGIIGLGTGSTAKVFVDEIGALVKAGRKLIGVPTSNATRAQAESLGIPLLSDEGPWDVLVTFDGADEIDPHKNLIKGGGGALLREKIVNFASRRNVIFADGSKLSRKLGEKWAVPVEVVPFAHLATARLLGRYGEPKLRRNGNGDGPFCTDSANYIYDLAVGPIESPRALETALNGLPGVVEVGLFVARADVVIVADKDGVRRL